MSQQFTTDRGSDRVFTIVSYVILTFFPVAVAYAAAIGLFKAVIGLVLLYSVNLLSRRLQGASLW